VPPGSERHFRRLGERDRAVRPSHARRQPTASEELIAATRRLTALPTDLIKDGQRRGEVRDGPAECVALPLVAALQGLATLAVRGAIPADQIEQSLDVTIAFLVRGYAPSVVDR
jgi:hypothetical protein